MLDSQKNKDRMELEAATKRVRASNQTRARFVSADQERKPCASFLTLGEKSDINYLT
jgi:hypothetical protein